MLQGGGCSTVRLYLQKVIWWWQLGCKERWKPLSVTKFVWSVKIRLIQDNEFGRRCVGSDIKWCNPHDIVVASPWSCPSTEIT